MEKNNKRCNLFVLAAFLTIMFCGFTGKADAALLNNTLDYPIMQSYGAFSYSYNVTTGIGTLATDSTQTYALALQMSSNLDPVFFDGNSGASLSIQITLDQNGNVVPNTNGQDELVVSGSITIPGVGTYNGVLLTAVVTEFGFEYGGSGRPDSFFDFRFTITGGQLANLWYGRDLGVYWDFDPTNVNPVPFLGNFNSNFNGYLNVGNMGGIKPAPMACNSVTTFIQVNNLNFFPGQDANGNPLIPVLTDQDTATFEVLATNCSSQPATILSVKREEGCGGLGTPRDPNLNKIVLNPGDSYLIDQNNPNKNFAKLVQPNICKYHPRTSASLVDRNYDVLFGVGCDRFVASGPAAVKCACIELKKQLLINDNDCDDRYRNADNVCGAPNYVVKAGSPDILYRYVISNPCSADLTNIVINDPSLGIVNYPVGSLNAGADPIVIDKSAISALDRPAASICTTNTQTQNGCGCEKDKQIVFDGGAATVSANAVTSPLLSASQQPVVTVTDQDSASVRCVSQ